MLCQCYLNINTLIPTSLNNQTYLIFFTKNITCHFCNAIIEAAKI